MNDLIVSTTVELATVLVCTLLTLVANKAKSYLDNLKKKDELGIIDLVTDRVVEFAEAELKGVAGKQKRELAVAKAVEILNSKGIKVTESEIMAGIENGVNKLKTRQQFLNPSQVESNDSK